MKMRVVANDLWFPEGPVWLEDGSLLVVEIRRQTLTRIAPNGSKRIVSQMAGGPNGAAIGPDGACYVCNNGGFNWVSHKGAMIPMGMASDYETGRIERVDMATGKVERLYDKVDGNMLRGPNDLVFDTHGGFWFTDAGKRRPREADRGGVYYAKIDGSMIREVIHPLSVPNGIGLSPDGKTLFVAETDTARLWAWDITGPGEIARADGPAPHGGRFVLGLSRYSGFDSLGVEAGGNICVATLFDGGITVASPTGGEVEFVPFDDAHVTNICFGGEGLRKAYITLSGTGQLVEMDWARPGLALNEKHPLPGGR
jgi:gluconolactonase